MNKFSLVLHSIVASKSLLRQIDEMMVDSGPFVVMVTAAFDTGSGEHSASIRGTANEGGFSPSGGILLKAPCTYGVH